MSRGKEKAVIVGAMLAAAVVLGALLTWVVWALWGYVAVPVFGAPAMSYGQTMGALLLLSLLAGFFKSGGKKS